MATFEEQINDLTGFGTDTDRDAINDWLQAGVRKVMDVLPMSKLERMSEIQAFTSNVAVEDSKILNVLRKDENNSNVLMPCRKIDASQSGRAADSSYMEFATSSDPVYYVENKRIYTLPASAASDDSKLVKIDEDRSTLTYDDTSIENFPREAESAVVLYASRNALIRLMNNMNTISALTVSVSAPSAPTLATVSYSAAANADASSTGVATVSVGSVTDVDPTGSVPTYTKPTTTVNFGSGNNFDTLLGTDEDPELASVEIQKQRELLSQYQTDIQNELNEFNKDNVRYQAEMQDELAKHSTALQRALTQAQIDAQEAQQEAQQATSVDLANKAQDQVLALQNAAQTMAAAIQNNDDLISKFNSELSKYSAQVNDEIQEYNSNLQKDVAKYSWYEKQYAMLNSQFQESLQLISVEKIDLEKNNNG